MADRESWTLSYETQQDLLNHLREQPGALLLRTDRQAAPLTVFTLRFVYPKGEISADVEVLQQLPGLGLVVSLSTLDQLEATLRSQAEAPDVNQGPDASDDGPRASNAAVVGQGAFIPKGSTVLSWPIEKLQTEWGDLTPAERIRLAKHGKRAARGLALRSQDKVLHAFLLKNNGISADEVAAMASMASLDPGILRQIATSPEWLRHTGVCRNLICNPKLILPLVTKVIPHLPVDEMRRLTKSGKVKAAIKRLLIRRIERGR